MQISLPTLSFGSPLECQLSPKAKTAISLSFVILTVVFGIITVGLFFGVVIAASPNVQQAQSESAIAFARTSPWLLLSLGILSGIFTAICAGLSYFLDEEE